MDHLAEYQNKTENRGWVDFLNQCEQIASDAGAMQRIAFESRKEMYKARREAVNAARREQYKQRILDKAA